MVKSGLIRFIVPAACTILLAIGAITSVLSDDHVQYNATPVVLCHPVVRMTSNDYTKQEMDTVFWNIPAHKSFSESYGTADYSKELRNMIIEEMAARTKELQLDSNMMLHCLNATGIYSEKTTAILPSFAEYAKVDGSPCWIFVFNWGFWDRKWDSSMGHIMIYAIDVASLEVVYFNCCN
jgi:hypothetical protein